MKILAGNINADLKRVTPEEKQKINDALYLPDHETAQELLNLLMNKKVQ